MNTAKVLDFSESLADKSNRHLKDTNKPIAVFAQEIGYARPTVSKYLSGTYDSDCTKLEKAIQKYFYGDAIELVEESSTSKRAKFYESNDARAVIGVCEACQEFIGLGIVVGRSGFGKTYSLKHYGKLPKVAYIECDDTMSSRDLVRALERELGLPRINGSIHERANCIKDYCNINKGYLIIIDEADKLISKNTIKKMEILRAVFDQSDVGIVLAGEPKLEVQIKNYDERMANRIDFYARLGGLSSQEVSDYLNEYDIDDEAFSELRARACGTRNGCFRLLDRTMNNVFRLLAKSPDKKITGKTIERASAIMML